MPGVDKVFITMDFTPLTSFRKEYEKEARLMFRDMGEVHVNLLTIRFLQLSAGGGAWQSLARKTIVRKRREMNRFGWTGDPNRILIRSRRMANAIRYRIRPRVDGYFVGFIHEGMPYSRKYSRLTVAQLANVHHFGWGRVPKREVVDEPDQREKNMLAGIAVRHFSKIIKGMNSSTVLKGMRINP